MPRVEDFSHDKLVVLQDLTSAPTLVKSARIEEGLSRLTEIVVEFACEDANLELDALIGKQAKLDSPLTDGTSRRLYCGICVEARFIGSDDRDTLAFGHYEATLRPWLWFLTRRRNSRIFQEMTTDEIIKKVFDDAGFSANYKMSLTETYEVRDYCVQYLETDYDFLCRLMEEVGIYFFFSHEGGREELVLADSISAHSEVLGAAVIPYRQLDEGHRQAEEHVFEWRSSRIATTDGVSYSDYDFITPTKNMATVSTDSPSSDSIQYGYGKYPAVSKDTKISRNKGDNYARVSLDSNLTERARWYGACNVRGLAAAHTFTLENHARGNFNQKYLVISATHYLKNDFGNDRQLRSDPLMNVLFGGRPHSGMGEKDTYLGVFEAAPSNLPFRAPQVTPWPSIPGIQTAVVVGPETEQIHTDRHGRVRLRFHWDALSKGETAARRKDELTCWTRVMQPWTGKNWGMIATPRIGQEVVVQFENGNPDRPVITGMMYNGDTMPPYGLPDNKTMSGVKTQTVGGGADSFSEFVIEDKKGEEYMRLQSERDYKEIIKNNAEITIGMEHKNDGSLTQTIWKNKIETLKEGDQTLDVQKGSQIVKIKTDRTETIEGKSTLTVTGDLTETVKTGNYSHKTSAGKITVEAAQSIELKVAGSSIKIDPSGVTIKGPMVKIDASGMAEMKSGGMASVKGGAIVMVKGPITMIN